MGHRLITQHAREGTVDCLERGTNGGSSNRSGEEQKKGLELGNYLGNLYRTGKGGHLTRGNCLGTWETVSGIRTRRNSYQDSDAKEGPQGTLQLRETTRGKHNVLGARTTGTHTTKRLTFNRS